MLKKLFLSLLIIAPLSMFAQKIAYVSVEEVFYKMPEMKDVESKLATKSETLNNRKTAMEKEYQDMLEGFQKTPTDSLTEAIILDRQKQAEDFRNRYDTFLQTSQQEIEKEQQTLLAPLQEKLKKAIKEVGDENGYTYVLSAAALLHVGNGAEDAGPKVKAKLGITD
jgi:outer membrane protein